MTPQTIVLIHGFWVTPRSWEDWIAHYEAKGHRVIAPAYPGFEVEVEALNADPTPIENLTVQGVIDKLTGILDELDEPPIIMAPRRAASLRSSCSTAATAPLGSPSTRRRPKASRSCRSHSCARRSRCSRTRPTGTARSA